MKAPSHSDCIMIALCSFYSAVFFRVWAPAVPLLAHIAFGAALYVICVLALVGVHRLRRRSRKLL